MREYTVKLTDHLYKDDYGKIRCKYCKRWINLLQGYCDMCVHGYEINKNKKKKFFVG